MLTSLTKTDPQRAWESWLAEHADVFLLFARQQTRCESDAKDVLQEVLIEVWNRTNDDIPEKALVFSTIRRRAIDLGRSLDRRSKRETIVADATPTWFVTDFSAQDTWKCLADAVLQLSSELREVLILRVWGDLTFPAIAEMLEIPCPTATSRYRYALEQLRQRLPDLKQ